MRRRTAIGLIWLALAAGLYFFENGTGTRIALACSLLLPLVPAVRRSLFAPDLRPPEARRNRPRSVPALSLREEDEPGDVRPYVPGDPVNRIHWKLSAKRDEPLVREADRCVVEETAEGQAEDHDAAGGPRRRRYRRLLLACAGVFLSAAILLFALPGAREGAQALANRLFDASEAVNAYVYQRFPVGPDRSVVLAAVLLGLMAAALTAGVVLSGSRWAALGPVAGCVLAQVYFGLALPAWANVALTGLFALRLMGRPRPRRGVLRLLAGIGAVALAVALLWPGTDAATEAASERARDALSRLAGQTGGAAAELPDIGAETRRVHPRTLAEGEGEARPGRAFRLATEEEREIAMPRRTDWLRAILFLLLTVAVVVVPFVPFALANARRRKAQAAREALRTSPAREAVCAAFQQVIAWLEATGNGAGNRLYSQWTPTVSERIGPEYGRRFGQCAGLFEEAVYSGHEMDETQRQQALDLLTETGETLLAGAGRRQKLRLRYRENLWI